MNRRFGFWKWLGLLGFSGLFLSVMLYVMVVALSRAVVLEFFFQMAPQTMLKGVSVLVIGVDQTARVTRSDSILVFHLDPDRKRIGVLSVPRDTRVPVKGHGLTKINHAYAFGGVNLLRETVSNLLSIPIDYYIKVDLKGVSKIIDVLGGLQVDVEKDLQYQDQAAGLEIDIKEGRQILDGEKAVQYLRFRQDRKGDIGRIERQQYFLQLLSEKMTQPASILRLPLLLKQTYDLVATDLGPKKMLNLAMQFNEAFRSGNIQKGTLPGAITLIDGVSYWRPNITGTDKLIQRVIFGFEKERELVVEKIETADPEASRENRRKVTLKEVRRVTSQSDLSITKSGIQIEILNGFGVKGAASIAAGDLKKMGLRVVKFANAGSFNYDHTLLVDWKGNLDKVVSLAHFLEIDPSRIIVYDRPEKGLDVTMVLGKDWISIKERLKEERVGYARD